MPRSSDPSHFTKVHFASDLRQHFTIFKIAYLISFIGIGRRAVTGKEVPHAEKVYGIEENGGLPVRMTGEACPKRNGGGDLNKSGRPSPEKGIVYSGLASSEDAL